MSFLRSGGGGGGAAVTPARQTYTDMRGQQQTSTRAPEQFRDFINTARVMGDPTQAARFKMDATPQSFLYADGQRPQQPTQRPGNMVGSVQGMSARDPSTISSMAPRTDGGIGAALATPQARRAMAMTGGTPNVGELPPAEFVVERQSGAPAVGGGEPGVGEQGFGRRALVGAEGELLDVMAPPGTPEQGTEVLAAANPDLLGDPNMPLLGPGAAIAPDVNYVVPTGNRDGQLASFVANDPRAMAVARGPLSRNLVLARQTRGFGNYLMNV